MQLCAKQPLSHTFRCCNPSEKGYWPNHSIYFKKYYRIKTLLGPNFKARPTPKPNPSTPDLSLRGARRFQTHPKPESTLSPSPHPWGFILPMSLDHDQSPAFSSQWGHCRNLCMPHAHQPLPCRAETVRGAATLCHSAARCLCGTSQQMQGSHCCTDLKGMRRRSSETTHPRESSVVFRPNPNPCSQFP